MTLKPYCCDATVNLFPDDDQLAIDVEDICNISASTFSSTKAAIQLSIFVTVLIGYSTYW